MKGYMIPGSFARSILRKVPALLLALVLLSACQLFLGPDPELSDENVLFNLWKDFNEMHAYVNMRMDTNKKFNSWKEVYAHYKKELNSGDIGLFDACGGMLGELGDPHVNLYATGGNFSTFDTSPYVYKRNSSFYSEREEFSDIVRTYLKNGGAMSNDDILLYGIFNAAPHIGYIYIPRFVDSQDPTGNRRWVDSIDTIVKFMQVNTSALIVDVRYNSGGISQVAEYLASHFASTQINYLMASVKSGPGYNEFSVPVISRVIPAKTNYTKPITLITNRASFSAAEWFTLAMRTQNHVYHVGFPTSGALSIKSTRPMINGWYYTISAHKVTDMNGKCYEVFGISPYTEISGDEENRWIVHPGKQLESILDWFIQQLQEI